MWVGEGGILLGPLSHLGKIMVSPEDTKGSDPHHGSVGLAIGIGLTSIYLLKKFVILVSAF
jgi:hypothetical protein